MDRCRRRRDHAAGGRMSGSAVVIRPAVFDLVDVGDPWLSHGRTAVEDGRVPGRADIHHLHSAGSRPFAVLASRPPGVAPGLAPGRDHLTASLSDLAGGRSTRSGPALVGCDQMPGGLDARCCCCQPTLGLAPAWRAETPHRQPAVLQVSAGSALAAIAVDGFPKNDIDSPVVAVPQARGTEGVHQARRARIKA